MYESGPHSASVSSTKGRIELLEDNNINANPYEWVDFVMDRDSGRHIAFAIFSGFQSRHTNRCDSLSIPHWFAVALAATFAATPWLRWRFSLRTLLIAITLVALVLGLVVWLGT